MPQSIPEDMISCCAPPPTIQPRLARGHYYLNKCPLFRNHKLPRDYPNQLCKHRPARERGRPAKYAIREEKAAVDVARRRARRRAQRAMAFDRSAEDIPQFCQVTWVDMILLIGTREVAINQYVKGRQRGRPQKYPTSEVKAVADVERRRARRHDAAPVQRDTSGEEQAMSYIGTFTGAVDSVSISNHESPDPARPLPSIQPWRPRHRRRTASQIKLGTSHKSWQNNLLNFKDAATTAIEQHNASQVVPWSQLAAGVIDDPTEKRAETLLYRRCCLETYAFQIGNGSTGDQGTQKQVFYPFSMLRDTGSLTIETGKRSLRRAAGLLYSQCYPSVKEVFAAGNVYPFTNADIETLALDKKLRKAWELVGGGLSHQPAALIKAYLYIKFRCHYALLGSTQKSFSIREEHRVSKELFYAIDSQMSSRELRDKRLIIPTDDSSPYYRIHDRYSTSMGAVEHQQVLCRVRDGVQLSRPALYDLGTHKNRARVSSLSPILFLNKIDWNTLTFRQPHAAYMMFNNPSMQTVYRARYHRVRDVRISFVRVGGAYRWVLGFSAFTTCLDLLENCFRELCLCAFRKDVFFHAKSALMPEYMEAALSGEIPLCYDGVNNAMLEDYQPLQLAHGNRLAVNGLDAF
ncbi:hypothetical protein B0J15DRAFT_468293 [Fusarium solani]|uniref:Uncharacterized protein n=1 Tax=Fusarium solani TaxID=169388 RepID=A0A9P9GZM7_FUSSL|nr:uncharacterized protein B0J15DRAFT_468293 [Fusarium solani]KAH7248281.1 hypothetical protein B0J15DRAFT_468293 [Fusarium solani]